MCIAPWQSGAYALKRSALYYKTLLWQLLQCLKNTLYTVHSNFSSIQKILASKSGNIFKVPWHTDVTIGHDGIKLCYFQPTEGEISRQNWQVVQLQKTSTTWLHLNVTNACVSSQRLQTKFSIASLNDADVCLLPSVNQSQATDNHYSIMRKVQTT